MLRAVGFVGLVLGVGASGCSTTYETIVEVAPDSGTGASADGGGSSTTADGAADASSLPPDWRCLLEPVPPTPAGNVQLQLVFDDSSSAPGSPIVGAEVHACAELDVDCTTPLGSVTTGDAGIALLTVPGGFSGYYEVHAPSFDPAVLSRMPQLSSESASQGMASVSLLSAGASLAGVTQDPSLSIAVVTIADCTATLAAGITIDVSAPGASERVVYLLNNLPSTSVTQTDVSGSALIFNVPPGTLVVSASFAATNQPIRSVTTFARQGWVTFVQIRPDQATHTPI
jgi:hypothetical protein